MSSSSGGRNYVIDGRELIADARGLRVQVLRIGPGQCVPWHHHTRITDTFFCLEGPMVVETRHPVQRHELLPGQRCSVPAGVDHKVSAKDDGRCAFVIVQGVGEYDFVPAEPEC